MPALSLENFMGKKPYFLPNVKTKLLYDNNSLYVIWRVEDKFVRGCAMQYQGRVWEDSCVDFFYDQLRLTERLFQS